MVALLILSRCRCLALLPLQTTPRRGLDRLPASYANFYIANNVVLAPIFGHANDKRALEISATMFPDSPGGRNQLRAFGLGHGNNSLRHSTATLSLKGTKLIAVGNAHGNQQPNSTRP